MQTRLSSRLLATLVTLPSTVMGLVLLDGAIGQGLAAQPAPSLASIPQAQATTPQYTGFAGWCENRDRVPAAVKQTVEVLLQQVKTTDCDRAQAALLNLTRLSLPNQSLQSLEPLASLTNLTDLELSRNQIDDLSPLASLTNLTALRLSNNQIQSVQPLAALTQLQSLHLGQNQIRDVRSLGTLRNLTDLDLGENQLETVNLPELSALTNLIIMRLRGNPIEQKICPIAPAIVCHFDDTGETLMAQASEQANRGNLRGAIATLQQALTLSQANNHLKAQGTVLDWMGDLYNQLGDYAQALASHQQSLAVHRQMGDRLGLVIAETALAEIHERIGQYEIALEQLQQAAQLIKILNQQEIGKDREIEILAYSRWGETPDEYRINVSHSLARIQNKVGDYPAALKAGQSALQLSQTYNQGGNSFEVDIALAHDEIGVAHLRLGNFSAAVQSFQQALAAVKTNQFLQSDSQTSLRQKLEGLILLHLGEASAQQGKMAQASELYQQSLALRRQIGDRIGEGETLHRLGSLMLQSAQPELATQHLLASAEVWESTRAGLADSNKIALIETQENTYRLLQQALVAQNQPDAALAVAERGRARALVELLAQRLAATQSLPTQWQVSPPTVPQIQQIAQAQQATLVEYSVVEHLAKSWLYIWVISPNGEIAFRQVDLASQPKTLQELVRLSRRSIGVRGRSLVAVADPEAARTGESRQSLRQLHTLLIQPITDLLPTDETAPVIFIPHQALFLVPFAALMDAQGEPLIAKHTILTAPSIQTLQLTRQQRQRIGTVSVASFQGENALVVGNPTMPAISLKIGDSPTQLAQLPGAEREAKNIAQLLNTNAFIGDEASETLVKAKMGNARLIHLATHGLIDYGQRQGTVRLDVPGALALAPDPASSSSPVGSNNDGLLTSREILDLDLKATLAVLSACDTGRGDITSDGVIGLSRAFISAGTPSVIVSLWAVPDAPTAMLMETFYREWQATGNKAQALRQAMLATMKQHPAPKDWAAFTLIGEAD